MKNKNAFTLIEILVVVVIIGILATLAIVSLSQARVSARDARRVSDMKQLHLALEVYVSENGYYPADITPGSPLISPLSGNVLLNKIPTAPSVTDGDCEFSNYEYLCTDDGSTYVVTFCTGKKVADFPAGNKCVVPGGMDTDCSDSPVFQDACGNETVLVDSRDAKSYDIVAIGSQCWMAENLDYDNSCMSTSWSSGVDNSWCGYYDANNQVVYNKKNNFNLINTASAAAAPSPAYVYEGGLLYQWSLTQTDICPSGWHVASDDDFKELEISLGMNSTVANGLGYRGTNEASKLAINNPIWDTGNLSSDADFGLSAFNAWPAGYRQPNSGFSSINSAAYFWTSSDPFYRMIDSSRTDIYRESNLSKSSSFSIRCVKN